MKMVQQWFNMFAGMALGVGGFSVQASVSRVEIAAYSIARVITDDIQDTSYSGPYSVLVQPFTDAENGTVTDFDLYLPSVGGSYPGIVLGHGFSQNKEYQHDNAMHLASWGFVVLAPTFSSISDHETNGEEMLVLSDWLISGQNPFREEVDATRLGLAGHSAGGLSATVAAGIDADTSRQISAVVGLDPVDSGTASDPTGVAYAERITAPTLYITGIPYSCNSNGNSQPMWDAIEESTDKMFLRVTYAVHCDFNDQDIDHACTAGAHPAGPFLTALLLVTRGYEAAYDAFTAGVCQVEDQELEREDEILLIRKYLAAWFLARLADETWAEPYLYDGSEVTKDVGLGVIGDVQYSPN